MRCKSEAKKTIDRISIFNKNVEKCCFRLCDAVEKCILNVDFFMDLCRKHRLTPLTRYLTAFRLMNFPFFKKKHCICLSDLLYYLCCRLSKGLNRIEEALNDGSSASKASLVYGNRRE